MRIAPVKHARRKPLPTPVSRNTFDELRSSITLGVKIILDRAASAVRYSFARDPSSSDWTRIADETRSACGQWEEHGWNIHPLAYHRTPPEQHAASLRRCDLRGTEFLHLKFDSGYEPYSDEPGSARWASYAANRTAHAWVLRHPGPARPWLVCLHGYGCGIPFFDFKAFRVEWLYKALGLNVVLPVLPLHGPRRVGWQSGEGFFGGDVLDTLHAEAQAVWDTRRVLSWVRTQDPMAVGVYGLSLGGYNAALIAALEDDLSCVIAGIPATDFVRLAQLHNSPASLRLAQQCGLDWKAIEYLYRVISPLALPPLIPSARRYIFAGRADCIVPPDHVRDLWEHWGRPLTSWYDGSHLSFLWESAVTQFLHTTLKTTLLAPAVLPDVGAMARAS